MRSAVEVPVHYYQVEYLPVHKIIIDFHLLKPQILAISDPMHFLGENEISISVQKAANNLGTYNLNSERYEWLNSVFWWLKLGKPWFNLAKFVESCLSKYWKQILITESQVRVGQSRVI